MNLKQELTDWLDKQTITPNNIGSVRRACFVPWDSEWNDIVRNETAAREQACDATRGNGGRFDSFNCHAVAKYQNDADNV